MVGNKTEYNYTTSKMVWYETIQLDPSALSQHNPIFIKSFCHVIKMHTHYFIFPLILRPDKVEIDIPSFFTLDS